MRLAYFSPLPPERSGLADYSRDLLPELGRHASLTLFANAPADVPADLGQRFEVQPLDAYPAQRWQFDLALHQMGNSHFHAGHYPLALRYPGLVTLHEFHLHQFIGHLTLVQGDFVAYQRELAYARGRPGFELARAIRAGRRPLPVDELPLNNRLLDRSLGLIVHSQAAATQIRALQSARPLRVIPALMAARPGHSYRQRLGMPAEAVVFACLGLATPSKRLDLALAVFARLRRRWPDSRFLVVGEVAAEVGLEKLLVDLGLGDEAVTVTGYVPDLAEFAHWTATADVVINLRQPTLGETSATALRALAAGRPVVVFDHGWYGDLPDEVALKVPPGDSEALYWALAALAENADRRRAMGEAAIKYVRRLHAPERVAQQYVEFIAEILVGVRQKFTTEADFRKRESAGALRESGV